jgi:hypothetical protein
MAGEHRQPRQMQLCIRVIVAPADGGSATTAEETGLYQPFFGQRSDQPLPAGRTIQMRRAEEQYAIDHVFAV